MPDDPPDDTVPPEESELETTGTGFPTLVVYIFPVGELTGLADTMPWSTVSTWSCPFYVPTFVIIVPAISCLLVCREVTSLGVNAATFNSLLLLACGKHGTHNGKVAPGSEVVDGS